jgi:hypothetical protein
MCTTYCTNLYSLVTKDGKQTHLVKLLLVCMRCMLIASLEMYLQRYNIFTSVICHRNENQDTTY